MATPSFFNKLRKFAKDEGITFVVDETRTGLGVTGKIWGHDNWVLTHAPDIVTFGGKTGLSGYYSSVDHKLEANLHLT